MVFNTTELSALDHYQKAFSIYRTTKVPRWSTHRLLLDLASENSMIMHFILAVSINDVCYRQDNESPEDAKNHFRIALRDFIKIIKDDSAADYKITMAAFLFLYLYIPKQKALPPETISQLSTAVKDFVERHRLDSLCLEPPSETLSSSSLTTSDRNILARLIIWTYDEDVKCGFQGFGGYLAEYLTAHRERTMAVYEVSRYVLQAHFGTNYPQDQAEDDDDNAMELEFLWALTALWQDINELTQKAFLDYGESCRRIEQRFSLLQKVRLLSTQVSSSSNKPQKYSSVFQNSAITDMPRSRVQMNADYDVVLFNALKVYYFRAQAGDIEMEAPPDVRVALKNILTIIRRTFASNGNELHDRLQWPLFLAGIETDDGFYSDWVLSRISKNRAKTALETVIQRQTYTENRLKRLTIHQIRCLLFEGSARQTLALEGGEELSFWDTLAEF
jgi:Fungal specific transcription factor domain